VLPTLLQVAGLAVPGQVQGESLLGVMTAEGNAVPEAWRDRPAYAQADYPHISYGWSALQSLRTGKYLYVQAPERELYDQATDPGAGRNLATTSKAVADTLSGRIEDFRTKTSSHREAPKVTVDPATEEKLAALGYVASTNAAKAGDASHEADPKEKIETANLIHRANFLLETAHFEEAAPLLEQLIAKEPDMAILYGKSGACYMMLRQYDKALPRLRKAVELNPESPGAHLALSRALVQTHDFDGAARELEGVVAKAPDIVDAHILLETAYARANRVPETIQECRKVLELVPEHYVSYVTLGRFLQLSGDLEGAIPQLKKAATLQPKAVDPHIALAEVYDQLGRKVDAARERAEVKRLQPTENHKSAVH
jgi:tetratricopeptide (TPR) repeat protein